MASRIHQLAVVEPGAEIDDDVEIGPFCYVSGKARIGSGTRLLHRASVMGRTTLGRNNLVFPGAVLGAVPQDLKYRGEDTAIEVGDGNVFREAVTVNLGTIQGGGCTIIGSRNLIMACCHIAHDCILEDDVIMANGVLLGGHVKVEASVTFGGLAAIHHFATIGRMAFVGGMTRISRDVPPFMTVEGNPSRVWCVNAVGCKRNGVDDETINALKEAHRYVFRSDGNQRTGIERFQEECPELAAVSEVKDLFVFLEAMEQGQQGRAREALRE